MTVSWQNQPPTHYIHVSTSGFKCKIDFFDKPNQPKITCYPWRIIGYVLEKLGIATAIEVMRKGNHDIIYINTKDMIKWRHTIQLESCKGYQIDQAKSIDCILTGEGRPKLIPY
jgi:hypothetical protein